MSYIKLQVNKRQPMKIGLYFCFLFSMLLCGQVYAQNATITISGKVTDASDGLGLPGVNVQVEGTTIGTATDVNGAFSLSAAENAVLKVSFIGYIDQLVPINSRTIIDISLKEDVSKLDEVVVIGYGTRKKSHLTGAIAQIGGNDITAIQSNRVDDALAGKLAGVLIQNQDGEPGADPKIQVRAASSVTGDVTPLIVVDGYPISGNLATINPNDIESLEVLKDAASAAIYGSRGANGVILVTTKRGNSGEPVLSYNGYVSVSNRYQRDNILMTASEWADHIDANIASGNFNVSDIDPDVLAYRINAFRNSPDVEATEDWLFQTGYSTSHNINVSGSTDDINYYASFGYLNTEGVVITQGFERYNGRLNLDAKLSKRVKAGLNLNGFFSDRDIVGHDMRDLLRAYSIAPIYHTEASIAFVQQLDQQAQALGLTPFDDGYRGTGVFNNSIQTLEPGDFTHNWHYGRSGNGIGRSGDAGPAAKLDNTDSRERTFFGNAISYLQVDIIEGLNVKTVLGADIQETETLFSRTLEFDSRERPNQTALDQTNRRRTSVLSETTVNFAKKFGNHDISAVAGLEFQNMYTDVIALNASNVSPGLPLNYGFFGNQADVPTSELEEIISRRSVFGRINYAYDDRYLVSLSLRRDGDSRFGANNRSATFPAVSVGWNVHKENFYNLNFLSQLKLRFSYGSLGSVSDLGAYSSLRLLTPGSGVLGGTFLVPEDVENPDLTWQVNTETNFGINVGVLGNRITLGVNYYTSDIEDILIRQSVSGVFGSFEGNLNEASVRLNAGDVESSGLEFELSASVFEKGSFTWSFSGNFSTVNTKITDLNGLDELPRENYGQSGRNPVWRNYVGGTIGEMWGLETIGEVESEFIADPTQAIGIGSQDAYVVDQNGDGVIDNTRTVEEGGDLVKIGQNTPDFYWGMTHQFGYKDFSLSLSLQGSHGGEVYNIDQHYYESEFFGAPRSDFDADGDDIADHNGQHFARKRDQTDWYIQDASYIALRNVTLSYNLKPQLINKIGISSARVYAAASNLLYLWANDYTSFNPEGVEITNSGYRGPITYGVQVGASPVVRSFTLGVNITF